MRKEIAFNFFVEHVLALRAKKLSASNNFTCGTLIPTA
jgi:hypothetical protein